MSGRRQRPLRAGTCQQGRPIQGLMRPPVVVFLPPVIDSGLGFLQGGEGPGVVEEVVLQGLMPASDLRPPSAVTLVSPVAPRPGPCYGPKLRGPTALRGQA